MAYIKGFLDFVRQQGIVGLAIGLAIGTSAGAAVSSIVNNLINPMVGLILNGTDLSGIQTTVVRGGQELVFGWGNVINAIITLLATAFVIYYVVEKSGLTKLDKKKKD